MHSYSLFSNELTEAPGQLRPLVSATQPQADDELIVLDKQIRELELQLAALRCQRKQAWAARWMTSRAKCLETDEFKERCVHLLQNLKEQFRESRIPRSQTVAAQWIEDRIDAEWRNSSWAGSSSSGSGQRWAASSWTRSEWNTWTDSWHETVGHAVTNGSSARTASETAAT